MKIIILVAILLFSVTVTAQDFKWTTLPNAPTATRFNDVYFLNPDTGWIANGEGEVYSTSNGGDIWINNLSKPSSHFRSVGFLNQDSGFLGNVGPGEFGATDTNAIYRTVNGGENWEPVIDYTGSKPVGICGMQVLGDSLVFAVGRVRGPSYFVKSSDGGESWISYNTGGMAAGLIDVHFFNADTGFVVGLTSATHSQSKGIILYTTNGGVNWQPKYISSRTGEWCWKISFPNRNTGYVSLQRNSGSPINIIKTTDGGESWFELQAFQNYYFVQAIGFVNDSVGVIGGNSSNPSYITTNGGLTWQNGGFGVRMNRVRFVNDTVGYAVGQTVYKYRAESPVIISAENNTEIKEFKLLQNYPNPFNPLTTITYEIDKESFVHLAIYDVIGNEIALLTKETKPAGAYKVEFNAANIPSGVYIYKLTAGSYRKSKKLVIIK
jgi:photosystem II stability/assembly factor-like uncharacterized protein